MLTWAEKYSRLEDLLKQYDKQFPILGECNCRSCVKERRDSIYRKLKYFIHENEDNDLLMRDFPPEVINSIFRNNPTFRKIVDKHGDLIIFAAFMVVAEINSTRVGKIPVSKQVRCKCCGKILNKSLRTVREYTYYGQPTYLCVECRKQFRKCEFCDTFMTLWDSENVFVKLNSAKENSKDNVHSVCVCGNCKVTLPQCRICGVYVKDFNMGIIPREIIGDDVSVCIYCKEHSIVKCNTCGELALNYTNAPIGLNFRNLRIRRLQSNGACDQCACYKRPINEFNFRPVPLLTRTSVEGSRSDILYFGVEFEVERLRDVSCSREMLSEKVRKFFPPRFVYVKRDGSLSHGIEIVTQPFTWGFYKDNKEMWEDFFEILSKNGYGAAKSTGFHVNMSKAAFTRYQLYKFISFFYKKENRNFILALSDRRKLEQEYVDRYFRFDRADIEHLPKVAKLKCNVNGDPHHTAINLSNTDTIEVRIFEMSETVDLFHKNMEFLYSLYNYSQEFPIKKMVFPDYFNYILEKERKNQFRFLYNHIVKSETMSPFYKYVTA